MYEHHGLEHEFPRAVHVAVAYAVCSVPRSGSSLLCDALASTELAGAPREYFDDDTLAQFGSRWGAKTFERYVDELLARKTSPNGVFGFKAYFPQIAARFEERALLRAFPGLRCVFVTRRDRVRQAISLVRATATDQWAAHQRARASAPPFDASTVRRHVAAIAEHEAAWERYFAEHALTPLRIAYEDLVADYERVLRSVLSFVGVDLPAEWVALPPTLRRQSDPWSERWVRSYAAVARYGPELERAPLSVRMRQRLDRHVERLERRSAETIPWSSRIQGFVDHASQSGDRLRIAGWLLFGDQPAERIELVAPGGERIAARADERRDVAAALPRISSASRAGFCAELDAPRFFADGAWRFRVEASPGGAVALACDVRARGIRLGVPFEARSLLAREASLCFEPPPPAVGEDELLGVSIDTTSLCNLRCTMCALERDYPEKALMSLDTFRRLEDSFPRLRHVSLSLNAEPLLNKRLAEMVALAKHASRGRIVTSFATNATLLDEARARELLEAGLDALEVSLDGTTAPVFESIRVGARLEPVVANVARVARLKRALGLATPHVSLRYTLSRDNLADLASLLDLALRLEVDHLVVNGVEPYDEATAAKVLYGREADPRVEALFTELEQRAQEHGVRLDLPRLVPETIGDCRLTDHACVILVDGTVAPCSPLSYPRDFFFLGERAHHPRVAFGNVRERPLHEIWESPEYVAFRERLRSGELIDACRTCLKRAGVIRPLKHWKWLGAQRRAVAVQPRS